MPMRLNKARQNEPAASIYNPRPWTNYSCCLCVFPDVLNAVTSDRDFRGPRILGIDCVDPRIPDQHVGVLACLCHSRLCPQRPVNGLTASVRRKTNQGYWATWALI